jgi:HAD superfamily hydrolase (TIGR01509 family)
VPRKSKLQQLKTHESTALSLHKKPAAFIFDLDGTLVDSEWMGLEVLHDMACALGAPWQPGDMHAQFGGKPMAHCAAELAKLLTPHQRPFDEVLFVKQLRANMAVRFRKDLKEIPGAKVLLQALEELQIPFAIGTNGPREKAELTLGITGLRDLMGERLFCAPEVGSFKPNPALFMHVAAALDCAPEHCAVVEDSLPGLLAGLAAGMQVFSLHGRQGLPAEVAEHVHFIDSLSQLHAWLPSTPRTNASL